MRKHPVSNHGFTLVELMVTLVVAFLIIAAVYASYIVQQRTQIEQQQVTRIQQNLRAGMMMMTREFKMAGYDPTLEGEYGITTANKTTFAFTADLCEDGEIPKAAASPTAECPGAAPSLNQPHAKEKLEETYTYRLFDSNADGFNDALQRLPTVGGNTIAIAENIEQIEFSYIMKNGSVQELVTTNLNDIRAVQISLLARADQPDFRYTNQQIYQTMFGTEWNPTNAALFPIDNSLNYRRRILLATIELRNMGLL